MFMAIFGGLGGPILAVAYYITYQGQMGSSQEEYFVPGPLPPTGESYNIPTPPDTPGAGSAPPRIKAKAHAWLVAETGRNYQLNQGTTTLGRSAQNDIQIDNDSTVSRAHAKIVEQNNHFRFYDLGGKNGSRINDRRVRQPILLAPNDKVQMGDNTVMHFVTSQK
jgi:hypothetical protein